MTGMVVSQRSLSTQLSVLAMVAGLAFAGPLAQAQPEARPAASGAALPARDASALQAARAVARVAMIDLRLIESAAEADYQIADAALSLAMELAPNDTDLIRRRIEANWNAGRSDKALDMTRRLITLDPTDTVAQLRLISGMIGKRQTAPERLALYERYCASTKIDSSIRSRLAMDAALLAREGGDAAKFRGWLKQATSLDSTNKEAAMLALSVFVEENPNDVPGRVELLSNLLMADPLDPHILMTLSRQLADHGVFEHANRLHSSARDLLRKTGGEITPTDEVEALVLEWQVDGPAKVFFRISSNLAAQRRSIREYNENVRSTGIGIGKDLGQPEDLRLNQDTEKVRLATALASGDKAGAVASLQDMSNSVSFKESIAVDDAKRPLGATREAALAQAKGALIDLQFWRVIASEDLDKVEADLIKFADGAVEADLPGPDIVRALLTLRRGDAAGSLAVLDSMLAKLEEGQPIRLTTEFARGLALETLGRTEEALVSFRMVQRGQPLRPIGAMARFRIEKIIGTRDLFSPDRAAVTRIAEGIPTWVDTMVDEPKSFMSVFGESPSTAAFGEDSPITINIRNISQIPLAVGSDKPINSRFMLAPTLTGRASRLAALVRPEIVETDRVLRLMPRQTLQIPVHPDLGYAGFVLDLTCDAQARVKWKLIQGFTPSQTGSFIAGPLSLTAESPPVTRNPLAESKIGIEQLVTNLGSLSGSELFPSLVASRQRLWAAAVHVDIARAASISTTSAATTADPAAAPASAPRSTPPPAQPTATTPASGGSPATAPSAKTDSPSAELTEAQKFSDSLKSERAAIAAALAARFPVLSRTERILVAAMMPHAGQIEEMAAFDAAVLADPDPGVMAIAMLTRVKQPDDAALVSAKSSSDPRVVELATLLGTRLAQQGACYSKLRPGLAAMRGEEEVPVK
jgi:tetratricopeptide (TPR) repeat protein